MTKKKSIRIYILISPAPPPATRKERRGAIVLSWANSPHSHSGFRFRLHKFTKIPTDFIRHPLVFSWFQVKVIFYEGGRRTPWSHFSTFGRINPRTRRLNLLRIPRCPPHEPLSTVYPIQPPQKSETCISSVYRLISRHQMILIPSRQRTRSEESKPQTSCHQRSRKNNKI